MKIKKDKVNKILGDYGVIDSEGRAKFSVCAISLKDLMVAGADGEFCLDEMPSMIDAVEFYENIPDDHEHVRFDIVVSTNNEMDSDILVVGIKVQGPSERARDKAMQWKPVADRYLNTRDFINIEWDL